MVTGFVRRESEKWQRRKAAFIICGHKVGINEHVAAEVLGVTVDEVLLWDDVGAPELAERYLLLWSKKHLGVDWQGWTLSQGRLMHKGLIWRPETLLLNRKDAEKANLLEYEIARLKSWPGVMRTVRGLILRPNRRFAPLLRAG